MGRNVDYDAIAGSYDLRYDQNDYSGVERALLDFVGTQGTEHLLEVGCGTGYWLKLFDRKGTSLSGLDASAEMLAQARIRVPEAELVQGYAETLPWAAESFDHVICINAFHHFSDKRAFLSEARRVLRPGGKLLSIGLDPHTGLDHWCIYDYFEGTLDSDKARYPACSQIREWMRSAGFVACGSHEVQHSPLRLPARETLERGLLDRTVTSQLSILTTEEYERGLIRIRADLTASEDRGEVLHLAADLRLYSTQGSRL